MPNFSIKNNARIKYNFFTLLGVLDMVTTVTEMTKLWTNVLKLVQTRINDAHTFETFFSNSYIYDRQGNKLYVVVHNQVSKVVIPTKYGDLVLDCLNDVQDENYEIEYIIEEDIEKNRKESSAAPVSKDKEDVSFDNNKINPELNFSNFVVGEFNKDAHKAALYVARNGGTLFNPLFIYSNSGLGKTHLLHAIGNDIKENRMPNAKILYISAYDFVEKYIKYVRAEKDAKMIKDFFKGIDVLLFDDVQFLAEKVKTEEMFFYVYQDLINNGKRIIITSDRQPNELKGLEDRLITRFTQGLTVKINDPDIDTCVEILKQKIVGSGMKIEKFDANVIYFLAEKFSRNVRELEGALNALMFSCLNLLDEQKITMDVAIKAVSSIKGGKKIATQLNEQKIVNVVADYYNLTPSQITGKDRNGQIVLARHIAMYLIRKHLDVPLKKIGEMFGGKDHTTVMNALTKVDKELKTNIQLQDAINDLEKRIAK